MKAKRCFSDACVCGFRLVTTPDVKQLFILGQEKCGETPRDLCRKGESRELFLPLRCLGCLQLRVINMPKSRIWGGLRSCSAREYIEVQKTTVVVGKGLDGSGLKVRTMGLRQQGLSLL